MIKRGKQWPVYSFSPQMAATARAGHNLEPDRTVQISHAGGRDPGWAHSQGAGWEAEPPGLEPVVVQWCWLVSQTAPHLLCHSANSKPASNKTAFAAVVSPRWISCRGCHSLMTELTVGGLGGTWWSHIQIRIKYDSSSQVIFSQPWLQSLQFLPPSVTVNCSASFPFQCAFLGENFLIDAVRGLSPSVKRSIYLRHSQGRAGAAATILELTASHCRGGRAGGTGISSLNTLFPSQSPVLLFGPLSLLSSWSLFFMGIMAVHVSLSVAILLLFCPRCGALKGVCCRSPLQTCLKVEILLVSLLVLLMFCFIPWQKQTGVSGRDACS